MVDSGPSPPRPCEPDSGSLAGSDASGRAIEAFAMAVAHHQAGRLDVAVGGYEKALALKPEYPDALNNLGVALRDLGRLDDAVARYEQALRIKPDYSGALNNLGNALQELGRLDDAIARYEQALRIKPDNASALNNLAGAFRDQGRLDDAVACYRQALRLRPVYPIALNNLGDVLQAQGRFGDAVAQYEQALRIDPNYLSALNNLGVALHELGNFDGAIARYRQALTLQPDYPEALFNFGNALQAQGRFDGAIARYLQALRLRPNYPDALNNLGNALQAQGRFEEAIARYEQVLRLKPDDLSAIVNLGTSLQKQGRFEEAIARYGQALRLKPDDPDALYNLGNALKEQGRFENAIAQYEKVLRIRPDYLDALNNLGNALQEQGKLEAAIAHYKRALRIKPDSPDALNNLGNALQKQGQSGDAIARYEQALRVKPDDAGTLNNLGNALQDLGRLEDAIARYEQALRITPDSPDILNNLGNALQEQGRLEDAIAHYELALRFKPEFPDAINNLGLVLLAQGQFEKAIARFERALRLKPDYPDAINNLGIAYQEQGRIDDAIAQYERALRIRPDYAEAHWNESLLRLLTGDVEAGWRKYEWRWKHKKFPSPKRNFQQPLWSGENLTGKTILLHAEQGLGDTLQFFRYVPLVVNKAKRVILEVHEPLLRLLKQGEAFHIVPHGHPLPNFDLQCPLLSLPLAFGTTMETIPAKVPYLNADPGLVARWRSRLAGREGFKVGIAWRGSPIHKNDLKRSTTAAQLTELLKRTGNITYVILQKDITKEELDTIRPYRNTMNVVADITDFADTAAIVANLDLVISVDTSVAHLAGALGRPVWVVLPFAPEWRWMLEREDSPWYPTMRLFRQTAAGDWDGVFVRVATELNHLAANLPPPLLPAPQGGLDQEADATFAKALAHHQAGRPEAALEGYEKALSLRPDDPDILNNLGIALNELERPDEAILRFEQALRAKPDYAGALNNIGNTLQGQGELDRAIARYEQALSIRPDYPEALNNLGIALKEQGRIEEAIPRYEHALRLRPDYAGAFNNLGNAFKDQGRIDDAIAQYNQALRIKPDYPEALNNLGAAFKDMGWLDKAVALYERALGIKPDYAEAHWNESLVRLLAGNYETGWQKYEWRWKNKKFPSPKRNFLQPLWSGEDISEKTILLHAEQGFGDTIQFYRYVPFVARKVGHLILEVPAHLWQLIKQTDDFHVVLQGQPLPHFDVHCPLLSLPRAFGTTIATIPAEIPYLKAETGQAAKWRSRLAGREGIKVGIVWRGSPIHTNDRNRSATVDKFTGLFETLPDVTYVILQKDLTREESNLVARYRNVMNIAAEIADFADTAALLVNLDLVISVDTAVAHLAGALGRLAWVVLPFAPDWRWLMKREDSPWYPSLRLFRQSVAGDWDGVLAKVADELARMLPARQEPAGGTAAKILTAAIAHHHAGRLEKAVEGYEQALALEPNLPDALNNLGVAYLAQGRLGDAIARYEQALHLRPDYPDALNNLGLALVGQSNTSGAIARYEQAIRVKPDYAEAFNNLGAALHEQGKLDDAILRYEQALRIRPDYREAINNLGLALTEQGRFDGAIVRYEQSLRLRPDDPDTLYNLGNALQHQDRLVDAIVRYEQALRFRPLYPEALTNLGVALHERGRLGDAIARYRQALAINPDFSGAIANLGAALKDQGRIDDAIAQYERALRIKPDYPEALNNYGVALKDQGKFEDALVRYQQALRIKPDDPETNWNESLLWLQMGNFERGWEKYEWRWERKEASSARRNFPQPLWSGEDLSGKTILLHAEQGFGDTIQFYRYVPLVAKRAGHVILEVSRPLLRLFKQADGVTLVEKGQPLPQFAVHCPLLSLPRAFGTTIETIPAEIPYLRAEAELAALWRSRMAEREGIKIGIVWRGAPRHRNDGNRSTTADRFTGLFETLRNITYVVLQKDVTKDEANRLAPYRNVMNIGADIADFADTAAILANLDLVISVDTAVAHLAGSLGRPAWVVLPFSPDWRWLVAREDSPWYSSVRLFRQSVAGDWDGVFAKVSAELARVVAG
ncbi:MAG: tetratricopeptide repeat protein [Alphaproteobacteria bacterium]|nr:tetratricopeptide repeat protein [Alphaproteobacteria bacterium]